MAEPHIIPMPIGVYCLHTVYNNSIILYCRCTSVLWFWLQNVADIWAHFETMYNLLRILILTRTRIRASRRSTTSRSMTTASPCCWAGFASRSSRFHAGVWWHCSCPWSRTLEDCSEKERHPNFAILSDSCGVVGHRLSLPLPRGPLFW